MQVANDLLNLFAASWKSWVLPWAVKGPRFEVLGLGFRAKVWGLGFRGQGLGFWGEGLGFRAV